MARHDADINLQMGLKAEDVKSTIGKLQSKFNELSKLDFGKSLSKDFAQVLKDMKEVGRRANTVMAEIKKLETVRPTTMYANLSKELNPLLDRQNELNEKFRKANMASMSNKHRLQIIREETAAKNEQIKKENELIRLQNETSNGRKRAEKPLIDYKQLEEYKTTLQDYRRTNMQAMNYQRTLSAVSAKTDEVTAKMGAMEKAGTHVFDGVGTVQYNMYIEELREISDELTKYINITEYASNMPGFTPDSATSKWQSFMAVLRETHPVLAQIGEFTGTVAQTIIDNFERAASNIKQGFGAALQALPQLASKVVAGLSKLGGKAITWGLQKIGSLAKTAAKHLADMAKSLAKSVGSGIISKLKSLGSALTGIGKKTRDSNSAFKVGFMTLLRYGFGIRSVYFLFRRLRKALGEGIGNLAQYSPAFNTVISNFISALTQLKNSFATAFAPIINVVAPILTTFINIVSEAVTKVGMLIAALTGQKTFIRAKGVQTDFAGALDNTADSTNNANNAAKKYKRTLAGFDDVEILKSPDSGSGSGGSGGGGSGGGGTSPSDMFETVALPSGFEDWAARIKEAWANADFTDLGRILGEKIANALDNIPWDTIKMYAGKFGKSFATFINGLMSVDENGNSHLAQSIGRTIAEAVNTVFTFVNQFINNIDENLVGNFFADLFNSAINTIDWDLIANTISTGINKVFGAIESFADKFDFKNLGTQIKDAIVNVLNDLDWTTIHGAVMSVASGLANFVNSFFKPELFGSLGTTIAKALNTAISSIKTFAVNFDAVTFGKSIATGINNFFDTFNFESAGVTFTTLVNKFSTAITTALTNIKWANIGLDLSSFILSVPWADVFGDIASIASAAAGGLAALVAGLFSGLGGAIKDYFAEKQNQCGGDIIDGILLGVVDFFQGMHDWFHTYIFDPFLAGFKSVFGISSPAKAPELVEAAGYVGEGILQAIADKFSNIVSWVKTNILDPISNAIKGAKIAVEVALEKAKSWAGDAWELIKSGAQTIKKTVQTALEKIGDWAGDAWEAVKSGAQTVKKTVQTILKTVGEWTGEIWNAVKTGAQTVTKTISGIVDKTFTIAETLFTELRDAGAAKIIKGVVDRTFNIVREKFRAIRNTDAAKIIKGIVHHTFNTVREKFRAFTGGSIAKTIKGTVHHTFNAVREKFKALRSNDISKTIKGIIHHTFNSVKTAMTNLRDGEAIKTIKGKIHSTFDKVKEKWEDIRDKTVTITAKIKKVASDLWNRLTGKASGGAYYGGGWHDIPQYASGGSPHGTAFIAGEHGPEIVGHIGGRTEVLNQSQLAAVMYNAVLNGTAIVTKSIMHHLSLCTNTIIFNIGALLSALNFTSNQIYDINNLVEKLNNGLTDIVVGKVVPTGISGNSVDLVKALNTIIQNQNNVVTRDELRDILTDMFRSYMNIDFYLGDEQIARHANAGNIKLNRRYGAV